MERKGVYDIKRVLDWMESDPNVDTENNFKLFDGVQALSGLLGYKVFFHKGTDCCTCETKGAYFALEKTPGAGHSKYNNWHFNLYGKNKYGNDVLMTKDHIHAKSKGGKDELSNLQPMCSKCNSIKGSMHMYEFEAKQKGKQFSWDHRFAENVMNKLRERYAINIVDMKEYEQFCNLVSTGGTVHRISNSKSYIKIVFKKKPIYVVYSSLYHLIYSVLDPKKIEDHLMDIPVWGKGKEQYCLDIYNEIFQAVKKEYKTFPTDKETAMYFNTCTYPNLLHGYWKQQKLKLKSNELFAGKTLRMHNAIWDLVKRRLKLKGELSKELEYDERES